jgi:orotate phosphoribosyltransferase
LLLLVATGAIGIGILLPKVWAYLYVRPDQKNMVVKPSGGLAKGQNVVVVEDLINTGNSSLMAVEALICCWSEY